MLYILPPPKTPNPPSPWESILYSGGGNNNNNGANAKTLPQWDNKSNKRKSPPKVRLMSNLPFKNVDGSTTIAGLQDDNMDTNRNPKSLSECYFAGKGTALVLPATAEAQNSCRRSDAQGRNIRKHLQSIVDLLRPEETLKMAVKLESAHPSRVRYLVIISRMGNRGGEESCLLGIDCNEQTTVGLVLKVMADTDIRLDGDGGFSLSVCGRHHIFKPVSVQAMWSALQTLHKVSSKAREQNYFQGGLSHDWVNYYEERIESDRSCLNEWHAMDNLESKRPPSPDSIRNKPRERDETEKVIRTTLKEIMMSVDLDEVTSKYIRTRLEEHLDMDLGEYKSFIDQEMLTILGQMDAPTEIFDHVYLGSEWNASNYEELHRNGVGHILNVTREIDNFFPGTFDYLNVRVLDDEKTDLLKHWDDTFKYINKARMSGSKVLVHCKMGVSRSASVVIAYAMKAFNWDFKTAMEHVKEKRTCIKPNTSFLTQLETYQGMLVAMKNKEKLQRSKSETNLKLPNSNIIILNNSSGTNMMINNNNHRHSANNDDDNESKGDFGTMDGAKTAAAMAAITTTITKSTLVLSNSTNQTITTQETTQSSSKSSPSKLMTTSSSLSTRATTLINDKHNNLQTTLSGQDLRNLGTRPKSWSPDNLVCAEATMALAAPLSLQVDGKSPISVSLEDLSQSQQLKSSSKESVVMRIENNKQQARHVLMPCDNGESYSVSPNRIVHLPGSKVKDRVNEFESNNKQQQQQQQNFRCKEDQWDPGEDQQQQIVASSTTLNNSDCDSLNSVVIYDNNEPVWTSSTIVKNITECNNDGDIVPDVKNEEEEDVTTNLINNNNNINNNHVKKEDDPFSNQLDHVFEREEKKTNKCPSRQSSWSSYDSAVVMGVGSSSSTIGPNAGLGTAATTISRHSSWGSADTRILPSRNSSWGSYDMRPRQGPVHYINEKGEKCTHLTGSTMLESANSTRSNSTTSSTSSGMFPFDKDESLHYLGTVKRTRQKIESNKKEEQDENSGVGRAITPNIEIDMGDGKKVEDNDDDENNSSSSASCATRLSVSAPESSSSIYQMLPVSILSRSTSNVSECGTIAGANSNNGSVISTAQCLSVKKHRQYLENITQINKIIKSQENNVTGFSGKVKNLKKEFEAKTNNEQIIVAAATSEMIEAKKNTTNKLSGDVVSAPASPTTCPSNEKFALKEELTIKSLVGKFENNKLDCGGRTGNLMKCTTKVVKPYQNTATRFALDYSTTTTTATPIIMSKNGKDGTTDRPPISNPVVRSLTASNNIVKKVATSVIAQATKKQQQYGKTHPLAKLSFKKHNNSVYNTM